jgi:excisionase family DNA binding protein
LNAETKRLKPWNTMREVAEYWQCSVRTVQRRIKDGDLRAKEFGRLVRISRASVREYEEE